MLWTIYCTQRTPSFLTNMSPDFWQPFIILRKKSYHRHTAPLPTLFLPPPSRPLTHNYGKKVQHESKRPRNRSLPTLINTLHIVNIHVGILSQQTTMSQPEYITQYPYCMHFHCSVCQLSYFPLTISTQHTATYKRYIRGKVGSRGHSGKSSGDKESGVEAYHRDGQEAGGREAGTGVPYK